MHRFESVFLWSKAFFQKHRKLCKNVLTALMLLSAGVFWWRYEKAEQMESSSVRFLRAIQYAESGQIDKAVHALDHMPSKYDTSYTLLSQFLAADTLMAKREFERSAFIYKKIMDSSDPVYRALAAAKYAYVAIFSMKEDEAHAFLDLWIKREPTLKKMFQELKASLYVEHGKKSDALRMYDSLLENKDLSEDAKVRLQLARLACVRKSSSC